MIENIIKTIVKDFKKADKEIRRFGLYQFASKYISNMDLTKYFPNGLDKYVNRHLISISIMKSKSFVDAQRKYKIEQKSIRLYDDIKFGIEDFFSPYDETALFGTGEPLAYDIWMTVKVPYDLSYDEFKIEFDRIVKEEEMISYIEICTRENLDTYAELLVDGQEQYPKFHVHDDLEKILIGVDTKEILCNSIKKYM